MTPIWLLAKCVCEREVSSSSSFIFVILVICTQKNKFYHYLEIPLITSSFFLSTPLWPCFSLPYFCQLKNGLKDNLCLDQGPEADNVPIMYLCHGMTPQVSGLSFYSITVCSIFSILFFKHKTKNTDDIERS